jgi:hypothetical protein
MSFCEKNDLALADLRKQFQNYSVVDRNPTILAELDFAGEWGDQGRVDGRL